MSSLTVPFYSITKPIDNELVLIKLTEKKESHFEGKLLGYPCDLFMNQADATNKKKVFSWKGIITLNKEMFAKVDDPDYDKNIVKVSLTNINPNDEDIINGFYKNKQLVSIFIKLSITFQKNLDELWQKVIYRIDKKRRDEYEEDCLPPLSDYCIEEKDFVIESFDNKEISDKFFEFINQLNQEKPFKIISKIKIASEGGITKTREVISNNIDSIKYKFTFKYDTGSTFILESSSKDSSLEDHDKFIKLLQTKGTFVQCDRKKKT